MVFLRRGIHAYRPEEMERYVLVDHETGLPMRFSGLFCGGVEN
jgi:hypothetical protein